MHQLGELDPGTRCMGVLFSVPLRERGTRPRGRMARREPRSRLRRSTPSGSEGHVPYVVRYNMLYLRLRNATSRKSLGGWDMAHIAKYKATAVGKLCAHYNRWDGIDNPAVHRENIDKERTHLNYTLGVYQEDGKRYIGKVHGTASWATVKERIDSVNEAAKAAGKRATRSDAVVMADMVVTLPKNVPQRDAYKFFCASYQYIGDRVGRRNLMGGYVHMDETTPHMHVPFTPILDGRFNYKKMCDRRFYQTFHKGLGDHLEKKMGYRPEVELSEGKKAERALSQVRMEDIDAARNAITAPAEEKAARITEELAAAQKELRRCKEGIAEAQREWDSVVEQQYAAADELASERARLECLRQANDGIEQRVGELESIAADARRYESESRTGKIALLSRVADAVDKLTAAFDRGLKDVRAWMSAARAKALRGFDLAADAPSNRIEKTFDLSSKVADVSRSPAALDRQRVIEQARTASWDANRSNSRGHWR